MITQKLKKYNFSACSTITRTYEPNIVWFGHVFKIRIRLPESY